MATTVSESVRNASVAAATALMNGGDLQLMTSGGVALTTHSLSSPAFGAPVEGVSASNAIGSSSTSGGAAASYRIRSSAGAVLVTGDVVVVASGSPAPTNAIGIPSLSLPAGATVNISAYSYGQVATY